MPKNSSGIVHLVLLFLAIFIGIAGVGYYAYQTNQTVSVVSETYSEINTPTPKDNERVDITDEQMSTSNWETYNNLRYNLSISSPQKVIENNQENELIIYKDHQAPQLKIVLEVEESSDSWKVIHGLRGTTREKFMFHNNSAERITKSIEGPETMGAYFEYILFEKDGLYYSLAITYGLSQLSPETVQLVNQILSTFEFIE